MLVTYVRLNAFFHLIFTGTKVDYIITCFLHMKKLRLRKLRNWPESTELESPKQDLKAGLSDCKI